jgi:hypothetical protein
LTSRREVYIMPGGHPRLSKEEISSRGRAIYEQKLRSEIEAGNLDKFLIIDVETGDYEVDTDDFAASDRAHQKHPDGAFYGMRIGRRSSGTIGASTAGRAG